MYNMLHACQLEASKLEKGEISKEEYDEWRYKYSELDTVQRWANVSSEEFNDMLMQEMKQIEKQEQKEARKKRNEHKNSLTDIQFFI